MYSPRYKFPTEKNKVRSSIGIKLRSVIILIAAVDSTLISTTDFDVMTRASFLGQVITMQLE